MIPEVRACSTLSVAIGCYRTIGQIARTPGPWVAPSLKFATATIQRTSAKAAAGASKGGQFNDEPPF
jgi:hypothetical protein